MLVSTAQDKHRARDLGVPFAGNPGPLNAITDVKGVEVGYSTLVSDGVKLTPRKGSVRTGVTVVFPLGKATDAGVPAAWFSLNGNGEMTGTTWLEESGFLEGPVVITNTHSVGIARDAVVEWGLKHFPETEKFSLPVVAETYDGFLNDINGFHVTKENVFQAMDNAASGPLKEGNVGGGTGMVAYKFKGGTGTSSRTVTIAEEQYCVGVIVQANFGLRDQLRIAGAPVGPEIPELMPVAGKETNKDGSIIVVVATTAPLLPHQLKRVVKRVALALGRNGSIAMNSSGDIFIAFSTAPRQIKSRSIEVWSALSNESLDQIFEATIEATEEAIVNALVAAETMTGMNGNKAYALPHDRLRQILRKYGRLNER